MDQKNSASQVALYLLSYTLIGIPIAIGILFPNPMAIIPTSAMLAAAVAGFAHTSLGSASDGNNLEIESKGDTLLNMFQGLGLKGKFTASVAVFFMSFILFSGVQTLIYHSFETEESKVKRLSPKPQETEVSPTHTWISEDTPIPDNFLIALRGQDIGRLKSETVLAMLRDIAEKGYGWNKVHPLTYEIIEDCNISSGVCKNPTRIYSDISYAGELSKNEANVCPNSDFWRYIRKGLRYPFRGRDGSTRNSALLNP
jgi:hypothetical protein